MNSPMRRFQFALERFLDLRRWKEREWEIRLAHAMGKVIALQNRIAEIGAEIGASYGRSFATGAAIDIAAMARRELYVQRLAAERERKAAELAVRTREMEEVRARYLEAARDRKVLDKLKDRRAVEYYEHQRDEEYKAIDDMNTAAPLRGQG
jgi:flagellar FliJ protein